MALAPDTDRSVTSKSSRNSVRGWGEALPLRGSGRFGSHRFGSRVSFSFLFRGVLGVNCVRTLCGTLHRVRCVHSAKRYVRIGVVSGMCCVLYGARFVVMCVSCEMFGCAVSVRLVALSAMRVYCVE